MGGRFLTIDFNSIPICKLHRLVGGINGYQHLKHCSMLSSCLDSNSELSVEQQPSSNRGRKTTTPYRCEQQCNGNDSAWHRTKKKCQLICNSENFFSFTISHFVEWLMVGAEMTLKFDNGISIQFPRMFLYSLMLHLAMFFCSEEHASLLLCRAHVCFFLLLFSMCP